MDRDSQTRDREDAAGTGDDSSADQARDHHSGAKRIALSGASGLVGSAVRRRLESRGETVLPLVRSESRDQGERHSGEEIAWDPTGHRIEADALEGLDAVIHLAGENIADGRWTEAKKKRILDSRVLGTSLLAETLAGLDAPPPVLVCASAIGFYGSRGDEILDEKSAPGAGFLSEVCQKWEAAAEPARAAGLRTVHLRFGMILDGDGGALAKMLPPFRLGMGGPLGSGQQWTSWIHREDAVRAILFAIDHEALEGPVNAVSPQPVRNLDFTRTLGRVLHRPTLIPVPTLAVRTAFGEMGDELLLASTRVVPRRLEEAGFVLRLPELEAALEAELGRGPGKK